MFSDKIISRMGAQPRSRAVLAMSDDRPASVADIVVEELRKKEINRPIRLPKRDFFTRGQKLKVKDPWHILSGYDLEFAGMSTRERVARDAGVVRQASNDCAANKFGRWLPDCSHSADDFIGEQRKNAMVAMMGPTIEALS